MLVILSAAYILLHAAVFLPAVRGRFPRLRERFVAAFLVTDSLLAGLLLLELYFAKIHDQSDGFNLTQAGQAWFVRHWHPLNALGYRDGEATAPQPGQKSLVVLGDSFAAGHGVKRAGDRFSDVAARELGPGWRVYNVAKIGWDTVDETRALREFPVKPDVVVLSYCLNDIFHAAQEAGFPLRFAVNLPQGGMKALTESSALADYVYWRLARGGNLEGGAGSFWNSLKGAYASPDVWGVHARELAELADYCRLNGIRLVAVVFPFLQSPPESAPLTAKVAQALKDRGATVLDLSPVLMGRPASELVANSLDAHPNEAVHRQVGELLVPLVREIQAGGGASPPAP